MSYSQIFLERINSDPAAYQMNATQKVLDDIPSDLDSLIESSLIDIDGHIHFEYVIPRMGKRVDVLLVIENIIFIIEFKVGSDTYDASSITQLVDYTLDLKNFHEGSHNQIICPILIATEAQETNFTIIMEEDDILEPILSNGKKEECCYSIPGYVVKKKKEETEFD